MRAIAALALAILVSSLFGPAPALGAARRSSMAECNDHAAFGNTTLTIVTTVSPAGGMTWKFSDAPSVVAQRILTDLNANAAGITFKEASGVVPNLYINVTVSETNSGTQQDSAFAHVVAYQSWFNATSGTAPYVGWHDAIDNLSVDIKHWLTGGWHANHPCRLPDGTVRSTWP